MPLLQLPDTHETEKETVEPDLEGKHCLYQTEQCVDFGYSKTCIQIALFEKFVKRHDLIYSDIYFKMNSGVCNFTPNCKTLLLKLSGLHGHSTSSLKNTF